MAELLARWTQQCVVYGSLWDSGVPCSLLASIYRSNSLIISIYAAPSAQRLAPMPPPHKMIYIYIYTCTFVCKINHGDLICIQATAFFLDSGTNVLENVSNRMGQIGIVGSKFKGCPQMNVDITPGASFLNIHAFNISTKCKFGEYDSTLSHQTHSEQSVMVVSCDTDRD